MRSIWLKKSIPFCCLCHIAKLFVRIFHTIFFITVYRPVLSADDDIYFNNDYAIPVSQNKKGIKYFSYQIKMEA